MEHVYHYVCLWAGGGVWSGWNWVTWHSPQSLKGSKGKEPSWFLLPCSRGPVQQLHLLRWVLDSPRMHPLVKIQMTVSQCYRDEAGGDTTLKKKINAAICGERAWISDLLEKKKDAAPWVIRPVWVKYNSISIVRHWNSRTRAHHMEWSSHRNHSHLLPLYCWSRPLAKY